MLKVRSFAEYLFWPSNLSQSKMIDVDLSLRSCMSSHGCIQVISSFVGMLLVYHLVMKRATNNVAEERPSLDQVNEWTKLSGPSFAPNWRNLERQVMERHPWRCYCPSLTLFTFLSPSILCCRSPSHVCCKCRHVFPASNRSLDWLIVELHPTSRVRTLISSSYIIHNNRPSIARHPLLLLHHTTHRHNALFVINSSRPPSDRRR